LSASNLANQVDSSVVTEVKGWPSTVYVWVSGSKAIMFMVHKLG